MTTSTAPDPRLQALRAWLDGLPAGLGLRSDTIRPASADASFRRYFRVDCAPQAGSACQPGARADAYIVMDAPPDKEDCQPFVRTAAWLQERGVNAPAVLARDLAQGFLLLGDFGDTTYAQALQEDPAQAGALYEDALATLVRLQTPRAGAATAGVAPQGLPPYDHGRLMTEMRLFPDWYLARHLQLTLDAAEREALEADFERLAAAAQAQPQVLVHRDYHCRNLMRLAPREANPGVLDFQDAVLGPITYDLVSLLRDAYVEWPEAQQIDWAARYWELARSAGLPVPGRFDDFWRELEWMGLQRSLKILGIFARLCHRDGKQRYLADLPVVLRHTQRVAERYDAFAALARLLDRVHGRAPQTGYTF